METAVARALVLLKRAGLAAAPAAIDSETLDIWTLALEAAGLTPEDVGRATAIVATRERFFPQPVVLIHAIRPPVDEDLRADAAWLAARRCVQRFGAYASLTAADLAGDEQALWAVQQFGWERLCSELGDENQAILRAEFVRWYRLARDQHAGCSYIAGALERDNTGKPLALRPEFCGRPDWTELPAGRKALAPGAGLVPASGAVPVAIEQAAKPIGARRGRKAA